MKLVIDIDEEMYKQVIASDIIYVLDDTDLIMLENAIAEGKPLQTELEEIKAEIDDMINNEYCGDGNDDELITYGLKLARQKLDKHINKADCNNDCEHCEWIECPKD